MMRFDEYPASGHVDDRHVNAATNASGFDAVLSNSSSPLRAPPLDDW
jgi:hypothetical protein